MAALLQTPHVCCSTVHYTADGSAAQQKQGHVIFQELFVSSLEHARSRKA